MMISDSSPLIHLTRLGKIKYLLKMTGQITISRAVYEEVVREGKKKNYMESYIIENLVNEGSIIVKTLKPFDESKYPPLGRGELESLELAKQSGEIVIIDERKARNVARMMGLNVQTTIVTIFELLIAKTLEKQEYLHNIKRMGESSWISADIIQEYIERGERHG
jgi:predicted nucleic acid-binding protein